MSEEIVRISHLIDRVEFADTSTHRHKKIHNTPTHAHRTHTEQQNSIKETIAGVINTRFHTKGYTYLHIAIS